MKFIFSMTVSEKREGTTPLGLIGRWICFPRVVPRRTRDNRWALGRNPFGIARRLIAKAQ